MGGISAADTGPRMKRGGGRSENRRNKKVGGSSHPHFGRINRGPRDAKPRPLPHADPRRHACMHASFPAGFLAMTGTFPAKQPLIHCLKWGLLQLKSCLQRHPCPCSLKGDPHTSSVGITCLKFRISGPTPGPAESLGLRTRFPT